MVLYGSQGMVFPLRKLDSFVCINFPTKNHLLPFIAVTLLLFSSLLLSFLLILFIFTVTAAALLLIIVLIRGGSKCVTDCADSDGKVVEIELPGELKKRLLPCSFFDFGFN